MQPADHVAPAGGGLDVIIAVGDEVLHGRAAFGSDVDVRAMLIEHGERHLRAVGDVAGCRFEGLQQQIEERGLACTDAAEDADAVAAFDERGKVEHDRTLGAGPIERDAFRLDDLLP